MTRAFLFCDLREWTSFVETHGDAAGVKLLRNYRALVRREVARFHGAEIKTEGDSFYVVFDSASAALDCAVEIGKKVAVHNATQPDRQLNVGIGIDAGETVAFDRQFVGSAVNIGSRLASQARAGELLVSDTLRGLVRTGRHYPMTNRGALVLKGMSEPIRAWSIRLDETSLPPPPISATIADAGVAARPERAPGLLVCPVLIGREEEVKHALMLLQLAADGHGQASLVAGEAGVGKTAFIHEVEAKARERGFRIFLGTTLESDTGVPYAPFVAAIRSAFRALEPDRFAGVLAQTAPDLAQLFPELGKSAERPDAIEQKVVALAFLRLFASFAREAPTMIVVEDLHWADEASLALLHFLARELRQSRSVLVATYRSDELHRRHPMLRAAANLQRERLVTDIVLKRLSAEEIAELIRATLEVHAHLRTVTPEFRDAIFARAEGNPFFTEELLKGLVDSGGLYTEDDQWKRKSIEALHIPATVKEAVRARLEQLDVEARMTLSAAAVIGQRFDFELLKGVRGIDDAALELHLHQFIELQLVLEVDEGDDVYSFRHALTREVVYDDLLVRERKRTHRVLGAALATRPRTEPSVLAHHLLAAGDSSAAVPHLIGAAWGAFRADAPREAAAHLERALDVGIPDADLASALELLAESYHRFDQTLAVKAAVDAREAFRARRDARGESRCLRLLSRALWLKNEIDTPRAAAREAVTVVEGDECVELARAKANLAHLYGNFGVATGMLRLSEYQAAAEEALVLGERLGDEWTIANARITKAQADIGGPAAAAPQELEPIRLAVESATRHGFAEVAVRGYINLVQMSRDPRGAWRFYEEGAAYARAHGVEEPLLTAVGVQAVADLGEWDTAQTLLREIPAGTFARFSARIAEAWMASGREGPAAAGAIVGRDVEPFLRSSDPIVRRSGKALMAIARMFAEDHDGTKRWLDELKVDLGKDPVTVPMAGPLISALLLADAGELMAAAKATVGLWRAARFVGIAASADALFASDADACAVALEEITRVPAEIGATVIPWLIITRAHEALRRGLALGPGWLPLFALVRGIAERVRATYWLRELDSLRAEVSAGR